MTSDRETAERVRDQLCMDSQCVFSNSCGCIDAIAAALAAEREDTAAMIEKMRDVALNALPANSVWRDAIAKSMIGVFDVVIPAIRARGQS